MLNDHHRQLAAQSIYDAERARAVVPQISRTFPDVELDDAYDIQRRWAELHIAQGARVIGHKIGLTSRAMQLASKIEEPDYGRLLSSMIFRDGQKIPARNFIRCCSAAQYQPSFYIWRWWSLC